MHGGRLRRDGASRDPKAGPSLRWKTRGDAGRTEGMPEDSKDAGRLGEAGPNRRRDKMKPRMRPATATQAPGFASEDQVPKASWAISGFRRPPDRRSPIPEHEPLDVLVRHDQEESQEQQHAGRGDVVERPR